MCVMKDENCRTVFLYLNQGSCNLRADFDIRSIGCVWLWKGAGGGGGWVFDLKTSKLVLKFILNLLAASAVYSIGMEQFCSLLYS